MNSYLDNRCVAFVHWHLRNSPCCLSPDNVSYIDSHLPHSLDDGLIRTAVIAELWLGIDNSRPSVSAIFYTGTSEKLRRFISQNERAKKAPGRWELSDLWLVNSSIGKRKILPEKGFLSTHRRYLEPKL
ncbi:hypothetical protein RRG08_041269 [Elysia crispata]|uniref:Uncharacterized protein n=1 Tax=Elysia crispata TaxID=231223 RepID=A0AAE1DBX6_9GAST|nr:hypothetical protein RRG08_041269 [Elysia crispata]